MSRDTKDIFAEFAPKCRNRGFWPRPVPPGTKECRIPQWQRPDPEIPDQELQSWCERFAALRNLEKVPVPRDIRMADAAHWIKAAEPATGVPPGALLDAIANSQQETMAERVLNDSLVMKIDLALNSGPIEETMGELFERVRPFRERADKYFPTNASHLSRQLERLRPALQTIGIFVERGPRTRKGRIVKIWREDQSGEKPQLPFGQSDDF